MERLKTIIEKANAYGFLLFIISICINSRLAILGFDLWLLLVLLDIVISGRWTSFRFQRADTVFYIFFLYFATVSVSILYSIHKEVAIEMVIRRLPIALVPMLFLLGRNKYYNLHDCLRALISGVLLSSFIIVGKCFWEVLITHENKALFILSKSDLLLQMMQIFMHRTYWGITAVMALIAVLYLHKFSEPSKLEKMLLSGIAILIIMFVIISEARSVIITTLLLLVLVVYKELLLKLKPITRILVLALLGTIFFSIIFKISRFQHLFSTDFLSAENLQYLEPRVLIWESAWLIVKQNFLFGVGVGDAQQAMREAFLQRQFEHGLHLDFNAHNQFLQSLLEGGIPLLIILCLMLVTQILTSNKEKRLFLLLINTTYFICLFFESVLNRAQGILLFAVVPAIWSLSQSTNLKLNENVNIGKMIFFSFGLGAHLVTIVLFLYLWVFYNPTFNPQDPSTFVQKPYEIINDSSLTQFPPGTLGFCIDSNYFDKYTDGNGYAYIVLKNIECFPGDSLHFSVYCKVQEENSTRIAVALGNTTVGYQISFLRKDIDPYEWCRLSVAGTFRQGIVSAIIVLNTSAENRFNMTEQVCFAYPEIH